MWRLLGLQLSTLTAIPCRIVHRDIKGGNVLITREGVAKLADMGASRVYNDPDMTSNVTSAQGSTFWCAPEVFEGRGYGRKAGESYHHPHGNHS